MRVSVLGLGAMGVRMAKRMVEAGHAVTVYNRSAGRDEALVAAGAIRASSPREAAAGAEVVIGMVRDDDASRAIWCDADSGALGGMRPGAVAVAASTLTPGWVGELADAAKAADVRFLEAPVVGTRPHADAGKLVVLAGGDAETLAAATPAMSAYAGAIKHLGPVGAGAAMKLVVNTLFATQVAAYGEALGVLAKAGVSTAAAAERLKGLPITSPALQRVLGLMAEGAFSPNFPVALVAKDLRYAAEAAEAVGADAPLTRAAGAVYARAEAEGHGGLDVSGIARLFG